MTQLIRNISDTARWVAVYRAMETERADALFRDPFAKQLAGKRGEEIAADMTFAAKHAWSIVTRTVLIDRFITEQIQRGVDMVVNLAAGLDARPYRMSLPANLQWIEVDLPELLDYEEEILKKTTNRSVAWNECVLICRTAKPAARCFSNSAVARRKL